MRGAPAGVKVRGGTDIAAPRRGVMHVNFGPPREDWHDEKHGRAPAVVPLLLDDGLRRRRSVCACTRGIDMRAMNEIVVFSHVRWNCVCRRPQQILTRLARSWRVLFIEEPLYSTGDPDAALCAPQTGVTVM